MQQSGSLRYYGHRSTVRWDALSPAELDRAMHALDTNGYELYIALEDWEEPMFRSRFAEMADVGALDWPPLVECVNSPRVRIYRVADRSRYVAGERLVTTQIGQE
jgi:hypothetical protein